MLNLTTVVGIVCFYIICLYIVAVWVERKSILGKNLADNALVYSLTMGVYCTAWTYYGSVGKSATSGMLFLPIYLGPTMTIIFWWLILRKLVRIKNNYRITSIADFISARYNRSRGLAAIATTVAIIGSLPYIALQLKAVITTFQIIAKQNTSLDFFISGKLGPVVVVIMSLFTILLGVRRLDPTERHPGMMVALALTSVVKLVAFLAVGIFVTYFMFHGFSDILGRVAGGKIDLYLGANKETIPYVTWVTYLILAMSAIMFLPRQFHVAVVENSKEKHIITAMWVFPLYMLLLNLFVYPIAIAGLLKGYPVQQADSYVLRLPLENGGYWFGLFAFLGGLSAAMGMIMINTMTIATMVTNHLILPLMGWVKGLDFLKRHLLKLRWLVVACYIIAGYWFEQKVGSSYILVSIGMISFAACLQFAPVILGGIFWKRANRIGAILGLSSGFLVWFYTLFIPAFIKSGWLSKSLIETGPWGIAFLNPEHLFGITRLPPLVHGVFWSMFFNIGLYVLGSLYFEQEKEEERIASDFVNSLDIAGVASHPSNKEAYINLAVKLDVLTELLGSYFPVKEVSEILKKCLIEAGIDSKSQLISIVELADLNSKVELFLAGSVGSGSAHMILKQSKVFSPNESKELSAVYAGILADLKLTPEDLKSKIDYYQEKEALIIKHSGELEAKINELEDNILERKRAEEALRIIQSELERRVEERTVDMVKSNNQLRNEIIERKKTEDSLRKSESSLITAQKIAHLGNWDWDLINNRIDWSEEIYNIFGLSLNSKEFGNTYDSFLSFVHPEDKALLNKTVAESIKEKKFSQSVEHRIVRPDASVRVVREEANIIYDDTGQAARMIGTIHDITERKQAEQELQQNYETQNVINELLSFSLADISIEVLIEKALKLLFTISWLSFESRGCIFLADGKQEYLEMKVFYGLDQAIQNKCSRVSFGKCLCGKAASLKKVIFRDCINDEHEISYEGIRAHGHYCVPIIFDDKTLGVINMYVMEKHFYSKKEEDFLHVVADVLAGIIVRKRAQQQLENAYDELKRAQFQLIQSSKMSAVGRLSSGVAHEINNPLTGVLNNVQLIKMEMAQNISLKPEEFKELLNVVEESALRCKNIVKSLLDFSHASVGTFQPVSLNEIVDKVYNLIGHEMKLQNVTIERQLQAELPVILGDSQLLQQIIFNLVSNAKWAIQKKSDKDGGLITIKTFYNMIDNYACINVTDTGIGIPKEDLDRIFEPFFSTKPVGEGTGLGLSLVYNVIRQHKGNIEVESQRGVGTTFKINIPAILDKLK